MNPDGAHNHVGLGYAPLVQRLCVGPDMVGDVRGTGGRVLRVEERTGIDQYKSKGDGYEKRGEDVSSSVSAISCKGSAEGVCRCEDRDFRGATTVSMAPIRMERGQTYPLNG